MPGTQWIVYDAQTGRGKASVYWPPTRVIEDCRVPLPVEAGDTLACITGERADEEALDLFASRGHEFTVADLLAQYPEAVISVVPRGLRPVPHGSSRRFLPGLGIIADQEIVDTPQGIKTPAWDRSDCVHIVPGSRFLLGERVGTASITLSDVTLQTTPRPRGETLADPLSSMRLRHSNGFPR